MITGRTAKPDGIEMEAWTVFRKELVTAIDIGAPVEDVWKTLTDFDAYP